MPNAAALTIDLGQTFYGPTKTIPTNHDPNTSLEGTEKWANDYEPTTSYRGARAKRSNRQRLFILVRNTSGGALTPKTPVKWEDGYVGKRVDGPVAADGDAGAGVVDENLPAAGVRDGDLFWLCVEGPHLATKATGFTLAQGAHVLYGEDDDVVAAGTLDADKVANAAGRTITAALTGDTEVLIDLIRN